MSVRAGVIPSQVGGAVSVGVIVRQFGVAAMQIVWKLAFVRVICETLFHE